MHTRIEAFLNMLVARSAPPTLAPPWRVDLDRKLAKPVSIDFKGASLAEVAEYLSGSTGVNVIVPRNDADEEDQDMTSESADIDDMLDEALEDDDQESLPTPPKHARRSRSGLSPTASAASWEYRTPVNTGKKQKDFKTPLVEGLNESPQQDLPQVEGDEGSNLFHTVSFYRRQKPNVSDNPLLNRGSGSRPTAWK